MMLATVGSVWVPAFQGHLRELLGITQTRRLGRTTVGALTGRARYPRPAIVYALRHPPADAAIKVRDLSKSVKAVLLLPSGLKDSTGLVEIPPDSPLPHRERVIADIVAAYNLVVPAILTAPEASRLVVDERFGKIWFDRVEISTLTAGTQAYKFVAILARNPHAAVNKYVLSEQLSPASQGDDYPARAAKADV